MSIQDEAYKFYRKIWSSPNRSEIAEVVRKIQTSPRGLGNKIIPTPILGLLLYDQQLIKNLLGKSGVEEIASWSEQELKILFGVHNQIRRLNRQCLTPLLEILPQSINAVNPYKEYPQTVSTEGFENLLFEQEDAEEVIKSFHTHPAFNIALSNLSSVQEHPLDYDPTLWQLVSEITEAGPGGEPQWVKNYEEAKRLNHPNIDIFRHVAALICLHDSLANLDQFIYHGLFQDEIMQINRSNLIDYFWTGRGVGVGMWLKYLSSGLIFLIQPADLVYLNIEKTDSDTEYKLYRVHFHGVNLGVGELSMRMVDENLNAYRDLIRKNLL